MMPRWALPGVVLMLGMSASAHAATIQISMENLVISPAEASAKVGDTIEVKDKSKQLALVIEATQLSERDVPDYIEVDHSKMTAKLTRVPHLTEVPYPVMMEPHLVVEYYSR